MKGRIAQLGIPGLLGRVGIIVALAATLMASRCSGDDDTGNLDTTGDIPDEAMPAADDPAAVTEPTDPLGDPFVNPPEGDPDDSSLLDEPSFEPESAPEDI